MMTSETNSAGLSSVPSEATEAGEGRSSAPTLVCTQRECRHRGARCWVATPAEPDAGEVDRLAAMLGVYYLGLPRPDAHERAATAVLASDWLAARDARVRREGEADGLRAAADDLARKGHRSAVTRLRDRADRITQDQP